MFVQEALQPMSIECHLQDSCTTSPTRRLHPVLQRDPPHPPALRAGPSLSPRYAGGEVFLLPLYVALTPDTP
jgi:hypothetical protein